MLLALSVTRGPATAADGRSRAFATLFVVTSLLHACRVIRELTATDGKLHEDWDKLVRKLTE